MSTKNYHIKTNRTFTAFRKYFYIYTFIVAFGGLYFPKLGLSVIVIMLGLILFAFFKGRYWCGNICSHGSLYDAVLMPFSRNGDIPAFFKSKIFIALFFGWFMYNWGGGMLNAFLTYEANTVAFWDQVGFVFAATYLTVTIIGSTTGLFFAPRTWCQFCPMGTMQRASYKLGKATGVTSYTDEKVTIVDPEQCHKCGKCARVCPMQLSPYTEFSSNNQLDASNCIRCSTCIENCPAGLLTLSTERTAQFINDNLIAKCRATDKENNRQRMTAKLIKIHQLKDDVRELTFETPERCDYKVGQFILVRVQQHPNEMFRAYSISSFDQDSRTLSVTVKKAPHGYGGEIVFEKFEQGIEVVLEGPLGHELLVDEGADKILLIGGGIGITPFRAIAQEMAQRQSKQQMTLIYGVNHSDEMLYEEDFKQLAQDNTGFTFVPVVANDSNWGGETGFVTDYLEKIEDIHEYKVYMCGPKAMVEVATETLNQLGVDKENISAESA
ncbi:4Fe-4S binding protein [Vibrio sp. HN007]|uniref:4Fe-4S binding protein n=1 Tax=Vibrio iocasae TaxID=3098914 RepID=UPI0035D41874